ncbi:cytochrome P450 [Aspergillus spectabilis]
MAIKGFIGTMSPNLHTVIAIGIFVVCCGIALALSFDVFRMRHISNETLSCPPHLVFTHEETVQNPMETFERAIRESEGVFTTHLGDKWRIQLAYIVSDEYTEFVFKDKEHFSFKSGVLSFLNVSFLQYVHGGSIMKDMDSLVTRCITRHLETLVRRTGPIIRRRVTKLATKQGGVAFDPLTLVGRAGAEATISIVLGKKFLGGQNEEHILDIAHAIADLAGMYKSESYFARAFPTIWRYTNWLRIAVFRIGLKLTSSMGSSIWKEMTSLANSGSEMTDKENITILSFLVREQVSPTLSSKGRLSLASRLWIITLCIIIIFASVHQTVINTVWTLYELGSRPESQKLVRDEWESIISMAEREPKNSPTETYKLLWKKTVYLDSFIREVLRMKGEVLGSMRLTAKETQLGRYRISKGQYVLPIVSLSNRSERFHISPANKFNGARWVGKKSAATIDSGYLAFGMGRWACPGRFLAIAEIKLLVLSLLSVAEIEVPPGTEIKFDKMDVAMTPPVGQLRLLPLRG